MSTKTCCEDQIEEKAAKQNISNLDLINLSLRVVFDLDGRHTFLCPMSLLNPKPTIIYLKFAKRHTVHFCL